MPELTIDDAVDISRAGLLYDKLLPLLEQAPPIQLNLEQVARIDGAGIQLIYAFINTARENGLEVELIRPSDVFVDAVNTLGLANFFEFPVKPNSS